MIEKLRAFRWPLTILGGLLLLLFFWHPFWHFWIEVGQKCDALLGGN